MGETHIDFSDTLRIDWLLVLEDGRVLDYHLVFVVERLRGEGADIVMLC